jgi:hypothetical protein
MENFGPPKARTPIDHGELICASLNQCIKMMINPM